MPTYTRMSEVVRRDGLLTGEMRRAPNFAAWRGGIHADGAAQKVGYRGGLVSGMIHNEQFTPLALAAFGPAWFERGSYSFFYRTPSYHLEPVQAFMRDPGARRDNVQVEAWCDTEDGRRVAEGTIGMGDPGEPTSLRRRFERTHTDPSELRIFRHVVPGQALEPQKRRFPLLPGPPVDGVAPRPGGEGQIQRKEDTTEPLEWYFGPSPWGGPIAGSLGLQRLLRGLEVPGVAREQDASRGAPGLDGGIEVRFVDGPVFIDTDYVLRGRVLGVSQSPKTEDLWIESSLHDPRTDRVIAECLLMSRRLKAASPLYDEVRA
jgi:hypothetical protein